MARVRVTPTGIYVGGTSTGAAARAVSGLEAFGSIVLSVVEGYTAREIAELLGVPRGTVLSLMHRARGKLRRWLRDLESEI